jgi:ParB/RepB/Spo0J family partition protein
MAELFDDALTPIPTHEIIIGDVVKNIRTHIDPDGLQELVDSISKVGLMHPITVIEVEDDDGNYETHLVAGQRRLMAVKAIQKQDPDFMSEGIPTIGFAGDIKQAEYVSALENIDRREVDHVDIAKWLAAKNEEGTTQSELGQELKRGTTWVNNHIMFHERACKELKELLREGLISWHAACELAKNLDADDQRKRVARARKFDEKISLEEAARAGNHDKVKKPSASKRKKVAAIVAAEDNAFCNGIDMSLRFVEGLVTEEEILEEIERAKEGKRHDS